MQRFRQSIIAVALFMLVSSCPFFSCKNSESDTESGKKRPLEAWVFRSVLDWKPRIITMAFSDNLWAAYSTTNGALYKTWKGIVYFDGPVYTHAHGPQPISIGDSYFENKFAHPWKLTKTGSKDTIPTTFNYKGHRFENGHVHLMYELKGDGMPAVSIDEMIEVETKENGQAKFHRVFTTKNVGNDVEVKLMTNVSSIVIESNMSTDGKFETTSKSERTLKNGAVTLDIEGTLTLKSNGTTFLDVDLMSSPTITNPNSAGVDNEAVDEQGLPEGAKLIARSDCKTCHNKTLKTIGPAYVAIADKYENSQANIAKLVLKIKTGGTGVWGNQVMTAHADLPESDVQKMVSYIMDLDKETESGKGVKNENAFKFAPAKIKEEDVLPGAMVRVYDIKKGIKVMPSFPSTQRPKYAGTLNNFDNINGGGFKDLSDDFALVSEGYLHADTSGEYILEIWSDDGSLLYIDDKLVINNDSLHGTEGKTQKVYFEKGYHKFKFDFFQGGGGKYLALDWTKPGDKAAEVIPSENIVHSVDQQGDLSDYTLPMSSVTQIPGDKTPLTAVHPAFDLSQARPTDFKEKIGGMDFKKDGRLVVSTWDAAGSVYIITNPGSGDPSKMTKKRIAFGLAEPLGLKIVNDTIYVMQKQEMTRLIDTNGDDIIDEYQTLADEWGVSSNFHEFGFGLEYKDGYFYATLATAINPGGASTAPQIKDRGKAIKVNKNTGQLQFIASGLRTPNGIGRGFKDEIFVADNQGDWLPSSKIVHIREGAWFGSRSVDFEGTKNKKETLPVVWLPQDEIGNSPSTPLALNVGPYKGQMIHGDVTHGGVKRVFVEEVKGELQGCVFRFIQGLEAGINRMVWGPDGALYVGGIGNPGNWAQEGKEWYGLQRLAYNNKSVFEMLSVKSRANGVEIEFTEPLDGQDGWNTKDYEVKQWYYKPTIDYGGPKLDERNLKIKSASVSTDHKKVFLELDGMKAGHVVYIRLKGGFVSAQGNSLWTTESWYTQNNISTTKGEVLKSPYTFTNNTLSKEEEANGWKLLFDGKSLGNFKNFKKDKIGTGWVINEDAIHLNSIKENGKWQSKDGGDIITKDEYENFELKLDWKIANCGNSGIMFNVVESNKYDYVWQTGPEMQVLDNVCHPDSRYANHRAGSLYDMVAPPFPTVKPAGEWNNVRIISNKGVVSFFLNGYKTSSFTMHTKQWKDMIAKSKFKDMPDFGLAKKGHLSLQDHGDKVWFRNIKIKELK